MNAQQNNEAVEAMLGIDLPGSADATKLPSEIQYMPPWTHQINASSGGKPVSLTVVVNAAGAERVAADFAAHMQAANDGHGDPPYFDFNHDDKEASARPKAFYWGGDDPQRGGIRARVEWTGSGRQAVLGRSYSRFSPTFFVNDSGEITGAPVCMGGLVNRAAFQRIAPIMSKAAAAAVLASPVDFMSKAQAMARARNLDLVDAVDALAHEQPRDYDTYRAGLLGVSIPARPLSAEERPLESDELLIRARALGDALEIDLGAAVDAVVHEQPALYDRYRARLFDLEPVRHSAVAASYGRSESFAGAQGRAESSEFFERSKAIAAQRSVDITEAFAIAAREAPDLYDAYRAAL